MLQVLSQKIKKVKITRKSVKKLCFITSSVVISLFLVFCIRTILSIVRTDSELKSNNSYDALIHEYALVAQYVFEQAQAELKQFANNPELRSLKTHEEVSAWLKKNQELKADFYKGIGFAFTDGKCITPSLSFDISDTKFFIDIISGRKEKVADGPLLSKDGSFHVVLARAVYDFNGNIKGIVSGTVKLSTLQELSNNLGIKNDGDYFLIGDGGKFICHFHDDLIGKAYEPEKGRQSYSSEQLYNEKEGTFSVIGENGKKARIFLEPVTGTDWSCGILVEEDVINSSYNQLRKVILYDTSIAVVVILLLVLCSTLIINNESLKETYFDSLTQLWQRPKFEKEAQTLISKNKDGRFAVFEVDCPGFKFINQSFGQSVGNALLKQIGFELLRYVKKRNGVCGRGYADHFYVLTPLDNVGEFMTDFDGFVDRLNDTLNVQGSPIHLKYGITFVLPDTKFYGSERNIQDLIGEASFAKSQIKNNLMQTYSIYSLQMQNKIERDGLIERHMENALANGEFYVVYQPKISLANDKITGAEALVRWNSSNKELGYLSPAGFIPVFEKNGFIIQLDFAVYEMVFKFLRSQLDAGNPVVPISVNVSRAHRNPEKFVAKFVELFNKYNLSPDLIEIEILERSSDDEAFNLITVTERFHEYGFTVAMDDFGSGQSSLNMLCEVPIDVLKFDQNFLRRENQKKGQLKMINTLIELGKQLNKKTLFEGVETVEERDMLKDLKCDQVQGYFYSKPLQEKDFIEFVKEHI